MIRHLYQHVLKATIIKKSIVLRILPVHVSPDEATVIHNTKGIVLQIVRNHVHNPNWIVCKCRSKAAEPGIHVHDVSEPSISKGSEDNPILRNSLLPQLSIVIKCPGRNSLDQPASDSRRNII